MRQWASIGTGKQLESTRDSTANLIILAERELAAFDKAVSELFGQEQASLATAEWIDELRSMNWPAGPGVSDFRRITTAASAKLAHRNRSGIRMRSECFPVDDSSSGEWS